MIQLLYESGAKKALYDPIFHRWGLTHDPRAELGLIATKDHLGLRWLKQSQMGDVIVDFTKGPLAYRRRFGGGRGEAVARAVGVKKDHLPYIMDATAGLGRDAFVLASIGCHVILFERHPVVGALLEDGLRRGYADPVIGEWMKERMQLIQNSSFEAVSLLPSLPDVVYLDPMYPLRQKSALVKKEMQFFQHLVGQDSDADHLLAMGRQLAKKRVVVKRPLSAPFLNQQAPQLEIKTKNHRFDVYLIPKTA